MNLRLNSGWIRLALAVIAVTPGSLALAQNADESDTKVDASKMDPSKMDTKPGTKSDAKTSAKDELGPHALLINSSLQEVLASTQGLKSQEKAVSNPASKAALQHAQIYKKEINESLSTAMTHSQELEGAITKYPEMAKSDSYQNLLASINDLKIAKQMWVSKFDQKSYLMNKDQATSDLDKFEKRLKQAIDRASTFNKDELKIDTHAAVT